ncbi:MAG: hypothetical protein J5486_00715 [Bacteroidaceae bacterium]|nr:hypothetical protein [Bacteroidaceae bacterium]
MRYATRAYIIILFSSCLGACHDAFSEGAFLPVTEDPSGTLEQYERVPIAPILYNPQFGYDVSQNTPESRGVGAFDSWSKDSTKWKNSSFHLFAYQTKNRINKADHGSCDMNGEGDCQGGSNKLTLAGKVLLYDRIMRINSNAGRVNLYEVTSSNDTIPKTFYFPADSLLTRYKFYAYYADNAEVGDIQRSDTKVTRDITIDGTQDVMHAFAYHTLNDFWTQIQELKEKGISENELRMLCNPDTLDANEHTYNNYLYTSVAAHRGFHPNFHINHLMTRLNVYVAGGRVPKDGKNDTIPDDYKNLIVTGVRILRAKTRGKMTIANDDWDEKTYQSDSIMHWYDSPETLANLTVKIDTLIDFDSISQQYIIDNYPNIDKSFPQVKENYVNIKSTEPQRLVKPILLAPSDSYTITLDLLYANRASTSSSKLNPITPFLQPDAAIHDLHLEYGSFQQGREYDVIIYVFGPKEIYCSVIEGHYWEKGDTINIDTEGTPHGTQPSVITIEE